MRFFLVLPCLMLAGCVPNLPGPAQKPPLQIAPPTVASAGKKSDSAVEEHFRQALAEFLADQRTEPLQQAVNQYPESLYALFAEQLLHLHSDLGTINTRCSSAQQQSQLCQQEKLQLQQQAQKLREQLEKLTRSMLEQEKRQP